MCPVVVVSVVVVESVVVVVESVVVVGSVVVRKPFSSTVASRAATSQRRALFCSPISLAAAEIAIFLSRLLMTANRRYRD